MHLYALVFTLGIVDRGIFSDLDEKVALAAPTPGPGISAVVDTRHQTLVVFDGARPVKVYPVGGDATVAGVHVRAADAVELIPIIAGRPVRTVDRIANDRDDDGIPDILDVVIGA